MVNDTIVKKFYDLWSFKVIPKLGKIITNNEDAISLTSKTQAELLRRLHVIQDGKVIGGAKAFLIIWSNIPKYNFLYKIF